MAYQSVQLVMRAGPNPGKTFLIEKSEIFIGRDIANDVLINDAEVSRRHARVSIQAGNYVIEDLGSTNGTFVNGQKLTGPRVLRIGDTVMFGENVSLTFEMAAYDPNATLIGAPVPVAAPPPSQPISQPVVPPPPTYTPPPPPPQPVYQPAPAPVYAERVPVIPVEPITPEDINPQRRTWLWVGCGCLVLVLCVVVFGAVVFDQLNMYCTEPFRSVTLSLGGVCP